MHILLIHQVFIRPQDPGGTRHFEFARHLTNEGHRVTVLAGTRSYLTGERVQAPRREELKTGLEVIRCHVFGSVHRSFLLRTAGFVSFLLSSLWVGLSIRGVDVIWGTSPPLFQGLTAWALARWKRIPLLFEVRDLWPDFAVQVGVLRSRLLIGLAKGAERFLYRRADRVLVNSPGFIDHVTAEGAPVDQVRLVPNGVDSSAFTAAADGGRVLAAHGLGGKFIALYAGAHGLANDLGVILQAADRLREDPRIAFVMVGDGKEKPALKAKAAELGLANLHFLPPLEKSRIPELLAEADCGIAVLKPIPLFATTYPNKVFDYMAAGLPVVLGIQGPIREVVEGADAGVPFAPGDADGLAKAVTALADDPERAAEMGTNGRACVVKRFDRGKLAAQMEEIFLELERS